MPTISSDVLARYATDAAREVEGVRGLVESRLRIELHVAVEWGASIPEVGRELQARVAAYLAQMAASGPMRWTSW